MKKITIQLVLNTFTLTLFIFLTSCFFAGENLGPIVDQERNVQDFDKLKVSSGIDVTLSQGRQHLVIIKANEEIIDDVETEVINGTLRLNIDRHWFRWGNATVKAEITFEDLDEIDISAGSDLESQGLLSFKDIDIEASAGSDLKLNLEADALSLRASSGSDAKIRGYARNFQAKASSGSDINAYDFEVENASLECSSGSDVKAFVTESLNVKASSGSDVHYKGNPRLMDVNTSSGSDLIKVD